MRKTNELNDIIMHYTYGDSYSFLTFEEYLEKLDEDKFNTISSAFGILNDPAKTQKFIKIHILHKDPNTYYRDHAENALKEEKNPNKALYIIDHILTLPNTDSSLYYFYMFKSECYFELQQYELVVYCTDQILKYGYNDSIQKSANVDIDQLYYGFLEPRVNSRIKMIQFATAIKDCDKFLNLIEVVKGKSNTIFAAQVYDLKATVYGNMNDKINESIANQTAEKIRDEYYDRDR